MALSRWFLSYVVHAKQRVKICNQFQTESPIRCGALFLWCPSHNKLPLTRTCIFPLSDGDEVHCSAMIIE